MKLRYVNDRDLESGDNWIRVKNDWMYLVDVSDDDYDEYMLRNNMDMLWEFNGVSQPPVESVMTLHIVLREGQNPPILQ